MQKKEYTVKQLVTAVLLGDGHLSWDDKSGHYGMDSVSGIHEKDYMFWKYSLLKERTKKNFSCKVFKNGNKKEVVRLYLWNKDFIEPYKNFLYYKDLKGRYHKNLKKFLCRMKHPICLAIWFMDDGSCQGHKYTRKDGTKTISGYTLYLGTNGFNHSDHEYMVAWFKREFKVIPKISKVTYNNPNHPAYGKTQYRLIFNKRESEILYKLMEPYIIQIPSMIHKFRFAYYLTTLQGNPDKVDFEINNPQCIQH